MNELELEHEITDLIESIPGLLWHHCGDSRRCRGHKGFPDLAIAGPKGVILRELKSAYGETDAAQDLWGWTLSQIYPAAHIHHMIGLWAVWRPEDLDSGLIEKELRELA